MLGEPAVRVEILLVDRQRLPLEQGAQGVDRTLRVLADHTPHALDRPEEIHRRRASRGERAAQLLEVAREPVGGQRSRAEREPHRRSDADRGRAADDELLDRANDVGGIAVEAIDFAVGKQALIEHHDSTTSPFDGTNLRHAATLAAVVVPDKNLPYARTCARKLS